MLTLICLGITCVGIGTTLNSLSIIRLAKRQNEVETNAKKCYSECLIIYKMMSDKLYEIWGDKK